MNLIISFVTVIISVLMIPCKAQELSLKQLIHLSNLCNSFQINDYLNERGWEHAEQIEKDSFGNDIDIWILSESNSIQNWLYFIIDTNNTCMVTYLMRNKESFDKTIKKIKRKGFRPIDTIQNENVLGQNYSYSCYFLNTLIMHEEEFDNNISSFPNYSITINKKKECEDFYRRGKTVPIF